MIEIPTPITAPHAGHNHLGMVASALAMARISLRHAEIRGEWTHEARSAAWKIDATLRAAAELLAPVLARAAQAGGDPL